MTLLLTLFLQAPPAVDAPHVVVVQPFVSCATEDGADAARWCIHEDLVDQVYAKAGVDFVFLEARWYPRPEARDGEWNLDQIWSDAQRTGASRSNGVLNAYFVNAVDGQAGPLGRGGMHMPVLFLAIGGDADRGMEAFVTAHEAGHCLGLVHSVDDPKVPDELVNLMGDGPYLERVGPDGLHDSQVDTVLRSALVRPRVQVLGLADARSAMLDESFEPFFSKLQPREMAAFLGKPLKAETLEAQRAEAREFFRAAALECTTVEEEALLWLTHALRDQLRERFPLIAAHPWRYLKYDAALCGGFAHTRGLTILLSQRHVDRIRKLYEAGDVGAALRQAAPLLLHEQMHVLERCYPSLFAELGETTFGFVRQEVRPHPWLTTRQVMNPDGLDLDWLIPFEEDGMTRLYWPRTLLRDGVEVPRMGADFEAVAVEVVVAKGGCQVLLDDDGVPVHRPLNELGSFLDRFPIPTGHDHPHEVAAYLMERVLLEDVLGDEESRAALSPMVQAMAEWASALNP